MAAPDYLDEDYDGPTYFIPQPQNVTFEVGQTATLRCSIENLGKKTVCLSINFKQHVLFLTEKEDRKQKRKTHTANSSNNSYQPVSFPSF